MKWWWTIYFIGVLCHPSAILLFFLFPFGLEIDYEQLLLSAAKNLGFDSIRYTSEHLFILLALAYGTFCLHFILTLKAKSRRVLLLLMPSLVLLVSGTVVGCHDMEIDHQNHPFQ